jgi:hypothetical protein
MECLPLGFLFLVLSLSLDATLTKQLQESWMAVNGVLRHYSRGKSLGFQNVVSNHVARDLPFLSSLLRPI